MVILYPLKSSLHGIGCARPVPESHRGSVRFAVYRARRLHVCRGSKTSDIMHLPKRLIDGYESFRTGRLPREQDRYHDLAEHGQSPEIMLIGCCDFAGVSGRDLRRASWRTLRRPQRRQPGAAIFPGRCLSRRVGGARVRGPGPAREAHRRAGARALRRHQGFRRTPGAAVAQRFHRQMDVDDRAGRGGDRAAVGNPPRAT